MDDTTESGERSKEKIGQREGEAPAEPARLEPRPPLRDRNAPTVATVPIVHPLHARQPRTFPVI